MLIELIGNKIFAIKAHTKRHNERMGQTANHPSNGFVKKKPFQVSQNGEDLFIVWSRFVVIKKYRKESSLSDKFRNSEETLLGV